MVDELLGSSDAVLRRFLPGQYIPDENLGRMRLSSTAFERRADEDHISCYVESVMVAESLTPAKVLEDNEGLGVARVSVEVLHAHKFDAALDPDGVDPARPHVCDKAHGAILEPPLTGKTLKKAAARLGKDDGIDILIDPSA